MPESGRPEVEPAILVQRTGLQDDDVDELEEPPVIVRDFAEVERNVVADSGVVLGAIVAAEVPTERVKMPPVRIRFQEGAWRDGETRADLDVDELVHARRQRLIEAIGLPERDA